MGAGGLILVVEPDDYMCRFVCDTLHPFFRYVVVADAESAGERVRACSPDLVLTDLVLPRRTCEDLVKEIRSQDSFARVPIVVLTATADHEARVRLLRGGAQDCLIMPFTSDDLLARVGNLVDAKRAWDRSAELHRMRDDFIALASHELRTPIATLSMQVQLATRLRATTTGEDFGFKLDRALARMDRQIERLNTLVDDLLDVARIDAGKLVLDLEEVNLAAVVRAAIDEHPDSADQRRIRVEGESAAVSGFWDRDRLRQVVNSLLSNALRYGAGTPVTISLSRTADRAILRVRDEGPGIAPDFQVRIFDRFEQGNAGRCVGGLGLGLFIAKTIVESHGGAISVESAPGAGSTFTVVLPVRPRGPRRLA